MASYNHFVTDPYAVLAIKRVILLIDDDSGRL